MSKVRMVKIPIDDASVHIADDDDSALKVSQVSRADGHFKGAYLATSDASRFVADLARKRWVGGKHEPDANEKARFLHAEATDASKTASYLVDADIIKAARNDNIPILYAPDSALHTAHGFAEGIQSFAGMKPEIYAVDRADAIPPEALEQAKQTGCLIYCDSVTVYGASLLAFVKNIPPDLTTHNGKPVEVICYSNYTYDEDAHDIELDIKKHLAANACTYNLSLYTNRYDAKRFGYVDRADAIKETDDPALSTLKPHLLKRPPKDGAPGR